MQFLSTVPLPLLIAAAAAIAIAGLSMAPVTPAKKPAPQFELVKSLASKWGKVFSVPVPMILTICHIESSFRPELFNTNERAMKLGGAWGVAAMTLTTAKSKIAQMKAAKLDQTNAVVKATLAKWNETGQALLDPDLCLLVAVYMLSGLWIKYKGDYKLVAGAYHQGSGKIDQMVKDKKAIPADLPPNGKEYVTRAMNIWPSYQGLA